MAGLLGPNCIERWKYLAEAYEKWDWLSPIFGDELEYRTSLVAYYMALHIHELAARIASGELETVKCKCLLNARLSFKVPLTFLAEGLRYKRSCGSSTVS